MSQGDGLPSDSVFTETVNGVDHSAALYKGGETVVRQWAWEENRRAWAENDRILYVKARRSFFALSIDLSYTVANA